MGAYGSKFKRNNIAPIVTADIKQHVSDNIPFKIADPDVTKQHVSDKMMFETVGVPVDVSAGISQHQETFSTNNPFASIGTGRTRVTARIWEDTESLQTTHKISNRMHLMNVTSSWVEMAAVKK